jgi:hypothetical protein
MENFQKTFDTAKVLRLLGAKQGRLVSPASQRRIDLLAEEIEVMLKPQLTYRTLDSDAKKNGPTYAQNI